MRQTDVVKEWSKEGGKVYCGKSVARVVFLRWLKTRNEWLRAQASGIYVRTRVVLCGWVQYTQACQVFTATRMPTSEGNQFHRDFI